LFHFQLAELLGKTVAEIEELPASELSGWQGYFLIKQREQAKAEAQAKARMRTGRSDKTFGRT